MRRDSVRVVIGGYEFIEFQSLDMVSDLYAPSGSFRFELGQRITADAGQTCAVWINGQLELTGIIDSIDQNQDKSSHTWAVSGRSMIGMIEDTYLTSWLIPPSTLAGAAARYLANIPYIRDRTWTIEGADPVRAGAKVDVGDTVFKVLNEMAQNRGLLFWAKPDGQIVFGRAKGAGEPLYRIGPLVKHRRMTQNTSKLHSEIWIVSDSEELGHRTHVERNSSVPYRRPFAAAYNGSDSNGLVKQAQEYLRQEKLAAFQLEYVVAGFSQNDRNWAINELAQVDDETFGLRDTYLISRRAYRYDRSGGSTTTLTLGPILAEGVFHAYPRPRRKDEPL